MTSQFAKMKFSSNFFDVCRKVSCSSLPIMYWFPKLHKTPVGARFIIASKNSCTKPLPGAIFKAFQIEFKHVYNFHNKSTFFSSYKRYWVVENYFPITENLKG